MEAGDFISFMEQRASEPHDLREALAEVAPPIFHEDETQRFETDTTAEGVPWAHLAQSTIDAKGHATILEDTGAMRAAATSEASGNVSRVSGDPGDAAIEYGVEAWHDGVPWFVHQYGTNRAGAGHKTTIPARPFIGLSAAGADKLGEALADHEMKRWG